MVAEDGCLYRIPPSGCPNRACLSCRQAPPAFPFHRFCAELFLAVGMTEKTDDMLRNLGQALAPTLPVSELSQNEAIRIAKQNFCSTTLTRITTICEAQYQSTTKTRARACACLTCFLSRLLLRLPEDVLSEHIAPLILSSPIQKMSIIFGTQTFELVEALKKHPARNFSVSCRGAIFESRFFFYGTSYITGLYNEELPDSHLVKASVITCRFIIIWSDNIGITNIDFLPSLESPIAEQSGDRWLYAVAMKGNSIHVRSKVSVLIIYHMSAINIDDRAYSFPELKSVP